MRKSTQKGQKLENGTDPLLGTDDRDRFAVGHGS